MRRVNGAMMLDKIRNEDLREELTTKPVFVFIENEAELVGAFRKNER